MSAKYSPPGALAIVHRTHCSTIGPLIRRALSLPLAAVIALLMILSVPGREDARPPYDTIRPRPAPLFARHSAGRLRDAPTQREKDHMLITTEFRSHTLPLSESTP